MTNGAANNIGNAATLASPSAQTGKFNPTLDSVHNWQGSFQALPQGMQDRVTAAAKQLGNDYHPAAAYQSMIASMPKDARNDPVKFYDHLHQMTDLNRRRTPATVV